VRRAQRTSSLTNLINSAEDELKLRMTCSTSLLSETLKCRQDLSPDCKRYVSSLIVDGLLEPKPLLPVSHRPGVRASSITRKNSAMSIGFAGRRARGKRRLIGGEVASALIMMTRISRVGWSAFNRASTCQPGISGQMEVVQDQIRRMLAGQLQTDAPTTLWDAFIEIVNFDQPDADTAVFPARIAVNCPAGNDVKMPDSFGSDRAKPLAVNCAAETASSVQLSFAIKVAPLASCNSRVGSASAG